MEPGARAYDRVVKRWLEVPFSRILCVEHGHQHRLPGKGKIHRFGDTRVTIYRAR